MSLKRTEVAMEGTNESGNVEEIIIDRGVE